MAIRSAVDADGMIAFVVGCAKKKRKKKKSTKSPASEAYLTRVPDTGSVSAGKLCAIDHDPHCCPLTKYDGKGGPDPSAWRRNFVGGDGTDFWSFVGGW